VILAFAAAILLACPAVFLGITWGLPRAENNSFLFGDRTPWTGADIEQLAGGWSPDPARGADVQRDPALDRTRPVELNDTDAKRADIVRRFRLYTYQPDEMINLRALSQMRPARGELDPRLYQYGGLWFYPAGALLKASELVGYATLRPDLAFYLDNPDAIARIYTVLRAMSGLWVLGGVAAMFVLGRQSGLSPLVCVALATSFAWMPGVVVFGHEAKPHVAGVVLVLWSVACGVWAIRSGRWWRYLLCAVAAGAACGTVVSMAPALLIPITLAIVGRREPLVRRLLFAGLLALVFAATYAACNPYVLKHLLTNPALLSGQLTNSTAMYRVSSPLETAATAFVLLMTLTPACILGAIVFALSATTRRWSEAVALLLPTAAATLVIFVMLAGGKPGEFARFGLVVASFGLVCAASLAVKFSRPFVLPTSILIIHLVMAAPELTAFAYDASTSPSRLQSAEQIRRLRPALLALTAEPAPYNLPPIDLWHTRLLLLPPGETSTSLPRLIQPPDADGYWKLTWADRRFRGENPTPPTPAP
jgi:hypothetical protein